LEEEAKKKEEQNRLEEERQLEEQKLHEQLKNGATSEEDPEGGYMAVALYDYQACKYTFYYTNVIFKMHFLKLFFNMII